MRTNHDLADVVRFEACRSADDTYIRWLLTGVRRLVSYPLRRFTIDIMYIKQASDLQLYQVYGSAANPWRANLRALTAPSQGYKCAPRVFCSTGLNIRLLVLT